MSETTLTKDEQIWLRFAIAAIENCTNPLRAANLADEGLEEFYKRFPKKTDDAPAKKGKPIAYLEHIGDSFRGYHWRTRTPEGLVVSKETVRSPAIRAAQENGYQVLNQDNNPVEPR